jgi:ribosomal protein S17
MSAVKNHYHDEIVRWSAREDGLRVCDDCDFTTEEGDCIVCPECRGSVG